MHACLRLHQCVRAIVLQALDMSILTLPLCGMRSSQHDSVMLEATSQIQSFCFHSLWTSFFKSRATVRRKLYDSDVVLPVERVRNHLDVRSGQGIPTLLMNLFFGMLRVSSSIDTDSELGQLLFQLLRNVRQCFSEAVGAPKCRLKIAACSLRSLKLFK